MPESDQEPTPLTSGRQAVPPSRLPVLLPPTRHANWRLTGILLGILLLLVLGRAIVGRADLKGSTASPVGAVSGYLQGLEKQKASEVSAYLAPAERSRTPTMLRELARYHTYFESPVLGGAVVSGSHATVTVSIVVCFKPDPNSHYSCQQLSRAPLNLPDVFSARRIGGRWYVTTVLRPR